MISITKNTSTCKPASTKLLNPTGSGNIVADWWYSKILITKGSVGNISIFLPSELYFLNYNLDGVFTL